MQNNLKFFDRFARVVIGVIFLFLSVFVFTHPVARLLSILFGLWGILEGISGCCPLYQHLGIKKPGPFKTEQILMLVLGGIQALLGYIWWVAGWQKITDPLFVPGFGDTLRAYALDNPYPMVKAILLGHGVPNADIYGLVLGFGEYAIGIILIALSYVFLTSKSLKTCRATYFLSIVAYIVGVVINLVLYFVSAHLGPSVRIMHVLMFWIQMFLIYAFTHLLLQKNGRS